MSREASSAADLSGPLGRRILAHRAEIRSLARSAGARNIRVFGSVARGDEGPGSDIDFLVDFPVRQRGLFPLVTLAENLEDILAAPVDVTSEELMTDVLRRNALADAVSL